MIHKSLSQMNKERKKNMAIYADCESKRRARLKWRKSRKGQIWDHNYYKRPEVKVRRHKQYLERNNAIQV